MTTKKKETAKETVGAATDTGNAPVEQYRFMIESDIIRPIKGLIEQGVYSFTPDGRLDGTARMSCETPWLHIRQDSKRDCGIWHHIWFNYYNIVPSHCQRCWKVVVRPQTLTELFKLYDILNKLDWPSKCGIERREAVPGLYGGYLYNDSEEEGLECLKVISKLVKDGIGPHIKCILKRGCTEFEDKYSPSSAWSVSEEQALLEKRLEDLFISTVKHYRQGLELRRHVMANWIRFAYMNADDTAHDYTNGPLYPLYEKFGEN